MKTIQFDLFKGVRQKEKGQDLVEDKGNAFVDTMRDMAVTIAQKQGYVTADDLRQWANSNGLIPHHPNAWGAIFRGEQWKTIGYKRSSLVSNHARTIRIWKLQQQDQ